MPNDLSVASNIAPEQIALDWGWSSPGSEIMELAMTALSVKGLPVGEIVIQWNLLPQKRVSELLQAKPTNIQTLDYFDSIEPGSVQAHYDRILALKELIPFYANLSMLQTSDRMANTQVHERCETLDAVLCKTDTGVEVLVFSKYSKLKSYGRLGRGELALDPIWTEKMLYAVGSRDDISAILKQSAQSGTAEMLEQGGTLLSSTDSDTPEVRELSRMIDHALAIGATDMSIKPHDLNGNYKVRLRRWGKMIQPFKQTTIWNAELSNKILQLLGVKSGANTRIETMRLPSDGNLRYRSASGNADFRLNFMPLNRRGDLKNLRSLAIRILPKTGKKSVRFDDLGVPEAVRVYIRDSLRTSRGVILVVGPVGSGKSSLCAAMVGEHVAIYGDSKERLSLEHPVERELEGITQFEVPVQFVDEEEEAWKLSLRSFKRHDLDFALVGEIRDRHSGEFCVSVGAMGQMAVSTMHADDTILGYDIIRQMLPSDMRFQAAEALRLCIGVRLINAVCQNCCEKDVGPNEEERRLFEVALENLGEKHELPALVYRADPSGCEQCDRGYGDYVQIYEVLPFTRKVKDAAISMLSAGDLRTHRAEMAAARKLTLLGSGLQLLREKKVDITSILEF